MPKFLGFFVAFSLAMLVTEAGRAQEKKIQSAEKSDAQSPDPRHAALSKMLNKVVLVGLFTVDGKPMKDLNEERYEIIKAEKLPDGDDLWSLESRIKYGKHDVTVPMVLTIKWADQTPVIVMDQVLIPGLGTFSARVVFHDNKYAGTWIHGEKGGHLFGRIEPLAESKSE